MKKNKLIVSSTLAILMSVSLISGATFSLFTSESTHDISVTAATVDLDSSINENKLTLYSLDQKQEGLTFANGGTASLDTSTGTITLTNITPGDEIRFNLKLTNNSNVKIKYIVKVTRTSTDFDNALVLTGPATSKWVTLEPTTIPIVSEEYKLKFIDQGEDVDNTLQNQTTSVNIVVEAHQYNDPALKEYTMSFNPGDGIAPIDSIVAIAGEEITLPEPPVKEGYNFVGWSENQTQYEPYIFPQTMPKKDVILYAHYEIDDTKDIKYLTFEYDMQTESYKVTGVTELFTSDSPTSIMIPKYYTTPENGKHLVKTIGNNAFSYKANLAEVKLPEGLEVIGDRAFRSTGLTSVVIPATVKTIGEYAFGYTRETLTSITFAPGNKCQTLGKGAFRATGITTIDLPTTITAIPDMCFYDSTLSSIELSDDIQSIGGAAFTGCTGLRSIRMPLSLTFIDQFAFSKDRNDIESLTLEMRFPKPRSAYDASGFDVIRTEYDHNTAQMYTSHIALIFAPEVVD